MCGLLLLSMSILGISTSSNVSYDEKNVKRYTFRGSNSASFVLCLFFDEGQLLRKEFAPLAANYFL